MIHSVLVSVIDASTRRLALTALCTALAITVGSACGDTSGPSACDQHGLPASPALFVIVEDSVTGAGGPFLKLKILAQSTDGYRDSVMVDSVGPRGGGYDLAKSRPGIYTITITAQGYQTWERTVTATIEECDVSTQVVSVLLQPVR